MPLATLDCGSTKVSNLLPIQGMPITTLKCGESSVADLSPTRGMKLVYLNCGRSKVADLSPLKGMPLQTLYCDGLQVVDLSPLRSMPLVSLRMPHCSAVKDLSPLKECGNLKQLNVLFIPATTTDIAALQKALPNCKIEWDDPAKPTRPQRAPSGTK
jgi:hypothetical protein